MGKKSNITRDRDSDISKNVALGMTSGGVTCGGEVMYDQRLFNQEKGMDSGFGTEDQYNVYDKGLFTAQPTLSTLYRPKKDADGEMYGGADEQIEKIRKTDRFKPDKGSRVPMRKQILGIDPLNLKKKLLKKQIHLVWISF